MIRQRVEGYNTCVIPELREGISLIYVIAEMKPSKLALKNIKMDRINCMAKGWKSVKEEP